MPDAATQSVDDYLASLPDGRREIVTRVHEVVTEAVPELEVRMWKSFIGYGSYHYRGASGREGDWFPIGLTNNKSYVSLYFCAAEDDGYLAEKNEERLGKVSVGRSCVRFKKLDDLNLDVVAELAQRAAALSKAGQFAM
jgi:Domain of unknown function (DU1801)